MKSFMLFGLLGLVVHISTFSADVVCDLSDPAFACGVNNAEDLVALRGTPWIVASHLNLDLDSGMPPTRYGFGPLQAVRIDTREVRRLFPASDSEVSWDRKTYPDCAKPPQMLSSHGLGVRPLGKNRFRLYAANHGERHSVEIIDVEVDDRGPRATWRGCAVVSVEDLGVWPNGVAPMPDDGFILSGYNLATWQPGRGWKKFPSFKGFMPGEPLVRGGELGFSNGVEVSPDGKWIFIADGLRSAVVRVPIDGGEQTAIKVDHPDNLRWGEDGRLYVASPIFPKEWTSGDEFKKCLKKLLCVTGMHIAAIDPKTLAVEEIMRNDDGLKGKYGLSTTALQIGDQLWIGTERAPYLAIIPLRP